MGKKILTLQDEDSKECELEVVTSAGQIITEEIKNLDRIKLFILLNLLRCWKKKKDDYWKILISKLVNLIL